MASLAPHPPMDAGVRVGQSVSVTGSLAGDDYQGKPGETRVNPVDNFLGWLESVWRSPLAGGRPPNNYQGTEGETKCKPVDNFLLSQRTYVCMGVGGGAGQGQGEWWGSGSNSGVGIEHMFDLPSQRCDYCHISP